MIPCFIFLLFLPFGSVKCLEETSEVHFWRNLMSEFNDSDLIPLIVATVNQVCRTENKDPICNSSMAFPSGLVSDGLPCVTMIYSGIDLKEESGEVSIEKENATDETSPFNATVSFEFSFKNFSLIYNLNGMELAIRIKDNLFGVSFSDFYFDQERLGRYECLFRWKYIKIKEFSIEDWESQPLLKYLKTFKHAFDKEQLEQILNDETTLDYLNKYVTPCNKYSILHSVGNRFSERIEYEATAPEDIEHCK